MNITTYVDQLRNWLEARFKPKKRKRSTKRCCISINNKSLLIVCQDLRADSNPIIYSDTLAIENKQDISKTLNKAVQKHHIEDASTYLLLSPGEYQVNLIESMPVPEDEILSALSWRVRSFINYPIDQAVLDYFKLPAKKSAPDSPLIAAITAQKEPLQNIVDIMKETSLNLEVIDIPELAMLQLVKRYEPDEKSTAFLYFCNEVVILNISCKKTLYITKQIALTFSEGTLDIQQLSLEVLRYFDFFRSQWRYPPPKRIFISGIKHDLPKIAEKLSELFSTTVQIYEICPKTNDKNKPEEIVNKYLLEYGCLLQEGGPDASTTN